jgi:hypothetical protein
MTPTTTDALTNPGYVSPYKGRIRSSYAGPVSGLIEDERIWPISGLYNPGFTHGRAATAASSGVATRTW